MNETGTKCTEGDGEYYILEDYITISLHVCDGCGKVFSKTFED